MLLSYRKSWRTASFSLIVKPKRNKSLNKMKYRFLGAERRRWLEWSNFSGGIERKGFKDWGNLAKYL
jgi:hypothetical protein